jgi:hypothetical protein
MESSDSRVGARQHVEPASSNRDTIRDRFDRRSTCWCNASKTKSSGDQTSGSMTKPGRPSDGKRSLVDQIWP